MFQLCKLLHGLEPVLRVLNRRYYSGIQDRVVQAHDKLLQLQLQSLSSYDSFSFEAVAEQEALLSELIVVEEAFLKQKSRIKWLNEGDQNLNFFHRIIKGR